MFPDVFSLMFDYFLYQLCMSFFCRLEQGKVERKVGKMETELGALTNLMDQRGMEREWGCEPKRDRAAKETSSDQECLRLGMLELENKN